MDEIDLRPRIDEYLEKVTCAFNALDKEQVNKVINVLLDTYERNGTIYVFGNGGSAMTASHFVCDFNKGVSIHLEKKFKFSCLCDNTGTVMAIANDCGYDKVFTLQLEGKLDRNDLILAISGSGNSENVIKAVEYARTQGVKAITFTGYNGGKLLKLSDYPIHVNVDNMQVVEDVHMMMCHLMSSIIATKLGHPMC